MNTPTVLVLGAGGRFGGAAVKAFADAGWRVLAQQRHPSPDTDPRAQVLALGLDDADALARAAAGATVLVHAVNPPYDAWDRLMLPLARQAMDLAERLGALFMLPGNVYAYGEGMPARLDESTPEHPSTGKGRLRAALEAELRDRAARGRLRAVVVRAGDFFGAGRGSWLDLAVAKDLARGRLVYPGPTDRVHAWAYLPDLARSFAAVAALPDHPPFEALHFAGHAVTGAEFLDAVEAAAGRQGLRRGGMPWPLLRLAGLFVPTLREVVRMSYLWRVPHALDGRRLRARIGAEPHTPLVDALRRSLDGLGLAGTMAAPHDTSGGRSDVTPSPDRAAAGPGAADRGLRHAAPATHRPVS